MDSSVKDKYIILGFIGFAILLISFIATLVVADNFNQDNFVRLMVFVGSNLLGWLLYISFQTVIFDTYEIYRIKFGKKEMVADTVQQAQLQEELPQNTPGQMTLVKKEQPDANPVKIAIDSESHEKNRTSYEDRQKQEGEERVRMVMEYIHFYLPRIADEETVNHICVEVNNWMEHFSYKPKPITRPLTQDVNNIPLRHFVWNISERFMYKKYYNGDNRAKFIKALFPKAFADTDIPTIKNFKVEPLKTPIPIDEPENGKLDFHYPDDYEREVGLDFLEK
uniref:transposase n=1 Tax=Phocaeicola dorei TaxID=357276 RepID=UPI003FF0BE31